MFDFCMITDRLTVKVNYILDAQNNRRFNFDTIILKTLKIRPKTRKIWENIIKSNMPFKHKNGPTTNVGVPTVGVDKRRSPKRRSGQT